LISLFTEFFRAVVPVIDSVELINGPGWAPDQIRSISGEDSGRPL